MKCPKGVSCSCGGVGRWFPMCEGIQEYIEQDHQYLREKLFERAKVYIFRDTDSQYGSGPSDTISIEDTFSDGIADFNSTKWISLLPLLTVKRLYKYLKIHVITKRQLDYIIFYFFRNKTLVTIGKRFRVSPSAVSQTIQRALDQLRGLFESKVKHIWH